MRLSRNILIPLFCILFVAVLPTSCWAEEQAKLPYRFYGGPHVLLDPHGDDIVLDQDFYYVDSKRRTWLVSKGFRSDGATIPSAFWPIIGSPLKGLYRNAAIIHDYFCEQKKHDWSEVHLVFYEAMLANGVSPGKA